jgi:cysteinyl-tRNA synthetase
MDLMLYNTLNRRKELFKPIKHPHVGIYTCGPTVYGRAHIGNLRAYLFSDTLVRVLKYNSFEVDQVMNITDVGHLESDMDEGEDKMMIAAKREKKSHWQIAEMYTNYFIEDVNKLNILVPTHLVKATDKIQQMIDYVSELISNGYAYETSDGIYFDISKLPEYGRLGGIDLAGQKAGARIEVNDEKINPYDFAVWKKAEPSHIMQWESPWGMGYPGWHLECSAISHEHFGEIFDIHTGGVDHIPIHHENEIAQSYGKCEVMPANYWLHSEFVLVDKGKMSKSLGNTYSLDDLKSKGISPLAYRYFCLNAHYRKQINFTWETMEAAQKSIDRLKLGIKSITDKEDLREDEVISIRKNFLDAINDDLNLPKALGILWELVRSDKGGQKALSLIEDMDKVFALGLFAEEKQEVLEEEIQELIIERNEARKNKDYSRADEIRNSLLEKGIELRDTPDGTTWKKV